MARIQPVLTPTELALVDQTAEITDSKRTEVSAEELGVLARQLAAASNGAEAAQIKERLTLGFYGI